MGPRPIGSAVDDAVQAAVADGAITSAAWLVAVGDVVHAGAAGSIDGDPDRPASTDTVFRISSMTKPVTAVAALQLVDDGVLALDDPVDGLMPELADRRVLRDPHGPLDDTVPVERPITLRDLLTFRMGLGMDFAGTGPQPSLARMAELGLPPGPPQPQRTPPADELMAIVGSVPLEHQPGQRWLYHLSADVLGVLIERATGRGLDEQIRQRIGSPLGMVDTGFSVPEQAAHRFGACFGNRRPDGTREVFDLADGQWRGAPVFCSGGAGLVSTVHDFHRFAAMLLRGGTDPDGRRLLSAELVAEMTRNQLAPDQVATGGPAPGDAGWGFGVGVQVRTVPIRAAGSYDWDGGLGSTWANDPGNQMIGILLTDQAWESPQPPAVTEAFWSAIYQALPEPSDGDQ